MWAIFITITGHASLSYCFYVHSTHTITNFVLSSDESLIALGSKEGYVEIYNTTTARLVKSFYVHKEKISSLCLKENFLIIGYQNGIITLETSMR